MFHIRYDDIIMELSATYGHVDSGLPKAVDGGAICSTKGLFLGTLCPVVWGGRDDGEKAATVH